MRNSPALLKIMFNQALNANGGHLFVTHTAAEWLFDSFYENCIPNTHIAYITDKMARLKAEIVDRIYSLIN